LYPTFDAPPKPGYQTDNLQCRKGPYIDVDRANVYKVGDLWPTPQESMSADSIILCDEYPNTRSAYTGKRIGMPVLYYKANPANLKHSYPERTESIYNYNDNLPLVKSTLPWDATLNHPIGDSGTAPDGTTADPNSFYTITRNKKITATPRPYNSEAYILISAGWDGLYGTRDDVFNFEEE